MSERASVGITTQSMHRMILKAPRGADVDHIDFDGLNNQKANLRLCTEQQNCAHSRRPKGAKSGFRGVYWKESRKRWCATVEVFGKTHHLGRFKTVEDAARAYDAAAKKYFGGFAVLNFPNSDRGPGPDSDTAPRPAPAGVAAFAVAAARAEGLSAFEFGDFTVRIRKEGV